MHAAALMTNSLFATEKDALRLRNRPISSANKDSQQLNVVHEQQSSRWRRS